MDKNKKRRKFLYIILLCFFIASLALLPFNKDFIIDACAFAGCALCVFEESRALKPMPIISPNNTLKRYLQLLNALPLYKKIVRFLIGFSFIMGIWGFVYNLIKLLK